MGNKHRGGFVRSGHGGGRDPAQPVTKYRGMGHTGIGSSSGGQGVKGDRRSMDNKASGDNFTKHAGTHAANMTPLGPMRGGIRF